MSQGRTTGSNRCEDPSFWSLKSMHRPGVEREAMKGNSGCSDERLAIRRCCSKNTFSAVPLFPWV